MEITIDTKTKEGINPIDLPKLFLLEDSIKFKENRFICAGCQASLIPCSYQAKHKKSPYFRILNENNDHLSNCPIMKRIALIKKSKKMGKKAVYGDSILHELTDREDVLLSSENRLNNSLKVEFDPSIDHQLLNHDKNNLYSINTTKYLSNIVEQFLKNPSIANEKLKVPRCFEHTYGSAFQKIKNNRHHTGWHIYFGSLDFEKGFIKNGNEIKIHFYQKWNDEEFILKVDYKDWPVNAVEFFIKSLRDAQDKSKKILKSQGNGNGYILIYFLGLPTNSDEGIFKTDNLRFIHIDVGPFPTFKCSVGKLHGSYAVNKPDAYHSDNHNHKSSSFAHRIDLNTSEYTDEYEYDDCENEQMTATVTTLDKTTSKSPKIKKMRQITSTVLKWFGLG